jgi:hypothetical protein
MSQPLNVHHVAIAFENGGPQFKKYPPGTAFDSQLVNVEVRYDHSSGGHVVTYVLRVTGARGPEGPLPYPSEADDRDRQFLPPDR